MPPTHPCISGRHRSPPGLLPTLGFGKRAVFPPQSEQYHESCRRLDSTVVRVLVPRELSELETCYPWNSRILWKLTILINLNEPRRSRNTVILGLVISGFCPPAPCARMLEQHLGDCTPSQLRLVNQCGLAGRYGKMCCW